MTVATGPPDPPDPPEAPEPADVYPPPRGDRAVAAAALAAAFLDGAWNPPAMGRRGKRILRDLGKWVTDVARTVHHEYPEAPLDRPRELARFIGACPQFRARIEEADGSGPPPWPVPFVLRPPIEMVAPRFGVPVLHDPPALAAWLGVTAGHLDWFADRFSFERKVTDERLRHYHRAWIRKADGSGRLLEAPKRELKDLQRTVLHGILDRIPPHPAAHGFTRRRSALTGARVHAGRDVVMRFDLESFFSAVTAGRVYGIFLTAGYPEPVAHLLAGLCTTTTPPPVRRQAPPAPSTGAVDRRRRMLAALAVPHLPQGSPTSPALANLAAHRFDRRMAALAARFDAAYTRYADDVTISGGRGLLRSAGRIVALVETIAADEGFRLNDAKTRVRTRAQRQVVTGLVVNDHPNVARVEYDRLRAILRDAAVHGPAAANREEHPDFRAHLLGRIAWAATTPARTDRLHAAFAAIRWEA
jgi:retron-type reverse transcriptase